MFNQLTRFEIPGSDEPPSDVEIPLDAVSAARDFVNLPVLSLVILGAVADGLAARAAVRSVTAANGAVLVHLILLETRQTRWGNSIGIVYEWMDAARSYK